MEDFEKKAVKKIIEKINNEISKLEEKHAENVNFVETANKTPDKLEIIEWALSAKENKSLLEELRATKSYFEKKYLKE
jgi:acetylglutamate kinase